jgi:hypothetical protein
LSPLFIKTRRLILHSHAAVASARATVAHAKQSVAKARESLEHVQARAADDKKRRG